MDSRRKGRGGTTCGAQGVVPGSRHDIAGSRPGAMRRGNSGDLAGITEGERLERFANALVAKVYSTAFRFLSQQRAPVCLHLTRRICALALWQPPPTGVTLIWPRWLAVSTSVNQFS